MEDPDRDLLPTISGKQVIMAYGNPPKAYVRHHSDSRVCTCLFWARYTLFVLNFLIWSVGVTLIALGAWALVSGRGLELIDVLLTQPCWLLIGVGLAMVLVGVFGCAGALRLNINCLRLFMLSVVLVFVLQLVMAGIIFFRMDTVQSRVVSLVKEAVVRYGEREGRDEDLALDYLQEEFTCCGASSYSDWETNDYYNCSTVTSAARCGVPASCCTENHDQQCGYLVREGTEEYAAMFIYTRGCVPALMTFFKDNVTIIAVLAFTVCFLELLCMMLANMVTKRIVYHRKLLH